MSRNLFIGICVGSVAAIIIGIVTLVSLRPIQVHDLGSSGSSHFPSCDHPTRPASSSSFSSAAVSSDAAPCSKIAIDILKQNGTAVDGAIAAMFCIGVFNSQSSGLGGGFLATVYSRKEGRAYTLNAREVAPKAAYQGMYDPEINAELRGEKTKWYQKKRSTNVKGGLAVGVPGEIDGLHELYKRFGGGVPWRRLLQPTIDMCEQGYELSWYTAALANLMRNDILQEPSMSIFLDKDGTRTLAEGEKVHRKNLANTLKALQSDPEAIKRGPLARAFVKDLEKFGGIITEQDLLDYKPEWRDPVEFNLQHGEYKILSFPPPGSGLVVGLILNVLDEFKLTKSSLAPNQLIRTHQLFAEAMKFAYAQRTNLGDIDGDTLNEITQKLTADELAAEIKRKIQEKLNEKTSDDPHFYGTEQVPPEDEGTAHLSLIGPNGDAVAITSSINMAFGAGIRSESTGIIYNNHMADFTTPEKATKPGDMKMINNLIVPGHRPLSSMSPTVILNKNGDVQMVFGAAGGIQIPSGMAWVAARLLWMDQDLKTAVDTCRSHHNLIPMKYRYETGFPQTIAQSMKKFGHEIEELRWKSVVTPLARLANGSIAATFDFRKSGSYAGF